MKAPRYPYKRHLMVAGVLSLVGQITAIAFMLAPSPYTTIVFMTAGLGMIVLGMLIFGYVTFKDVNARRNSVTEQSYGKGEAIFHQGERGDRVYVVQSGKVEVVREHPDEPDKEDERLATLGKGEYFGEMSLLSDAPRNATVRAITDATTLSIGQDDFQSLFDGVPAFKRSIEAVMRERGRQAPAGQIPR